MTNTSTKGHPIPSLIKVAQNLAASWWTHPEAVREAGTSNILFAGITTEGRPRIFRSKPGDTGIPAATENAILWDDGDPDDHNSVSILSIPGKKVIAFWQRHQVSPYLNWWRAPEGTFNFGSKLRATFPSDVTYSQVFNISGDHSIVFVRCTDGWYYITTTDHFLTTSAPQKFLSGTTGRIYLDIQPSDATPGLLHFAGAMNPTSPTPHYICYGTIDLNTGVVTKGDGAPLANLFTHAGLPLDQTDLADLAVTDQPTDKVRLLDVHEVNGVPVIAYAKWGGSLVSSYWLAVFGPTGVVRIPLGIPTGPDFGKVTYIAGVHFDRTRQGLYVGREDEAGVSFIDYYPIDSAFALGEKVQLASSSTYRLIRPYAIRGFDGAVWQEVHTYGGYTDYVIHLWLYKA